MIRNSIAIQEGTNIDNPNISFYHGGSSQDPGAFFSIPGDTWLWTGHGTVVNGNLLIFLFEQTSTQEGLGFKSVGWYLAVIENPEYPPAEWKVNYFKGVRPNEILIGSSAVLKDDRYVYAYGEREPSTHEVYLIRFRADQLQAGDFSSMEWWDQGSWKSNWENVSDRAILFYGQTEFSVHFDTGLDKYIQIQTMDFGQSQLGFRHAPRPEGPWSEPVIFYSPQYEDNQEFGYSANAHPEIEAEGIIITYNINNFDFAKLVTNEQIYFPRIIQLKFTAL